MRKTRLKVDQIRAIDHFCESLFVMFPTMLGVSHVGSSLKRDDWRDVDLRVIMSNEEYEKLYLLLTMDDLNALLSRWGQQVTGLPIDCQLQPQSEHQALSIVDGEVRYNWRGAGRIGTHARNIRIAKENEDATEGM